MRFIKRRERGRAVAFVLMLAGLGVLMVQVPDEGAWLASWQVAVAVSAVLIGLTMWARVERVFASGVGREWNRLVEQPTFGPRTTAAVVAVEGQHWRYNGERWEVV